MSDLPLLPASVVAESGYQPGDSSPDEPVAPLLPAPIVVPTLDDGPGGNVVYPDYNAANSFVVSGPLGTANHKGRRFITPEQAEKYLKERYHRVFEFGYVPGRWFGRVPRPLSSQTTDGVRALPSGSDEGSGAHGDGR